MHPRWISSKYSLNVQRYRQDSDGSNNVLDTHSYNRAHSRNSNCNWDGNWFHYVDAWDFTFFSAELTKHYDQLKLHVFMKLANLKLVSKSEYRDYIHEMYTFEITNLPSKTSKIYQLALKHMNEDNPQIEKEIEALEDKLKNHNNSVIQLKNKIDESIKQRFTTTSSTPMQTGGIKYNYNHRSVYKLLSLIWQPHSLSQTINERVDKFIKSPSTGRWDEVTNDFIFNGLSLGNGTKDEFEQMRSDLFCIVSDNGVITKIISIQNSEEDLRERIVDIKKLVDPIIELIDQGLYDTKIKKCCPTFWSLVRKYI